MKLKAGSDYIAHKKSPSTHKDTRTQSILAQDTPIWLMLWGGASLGYFLSNGLFWVIKMMVKVNALAIAK